MSGHQSLSVALGARSYEILVGEGLLAGAGRYIKPLLQHDRVIRGKWSKEHSV